MLRARRTQQVATVGMLNANLPSSPVATAGLPGCSCPVSLLGNAVSSTATVTAAARTYFAPTQGSLAPKRKPLRRDANNLSKAAGGSGATNGVYDEEEVFGHTSRAVSMAERRRQQRQKQVKELRNAESARKDAAFEEAVQRAGEEGSAPRGPSSRFQSSRAPPTVATTQEVEEVMANTEDSDLLNSIDADAADDVDNLADSYHDGNPSSRGGNSNTRVGRKERLAAEALTRSVEGGVLSDSTLSRGGTNMSGTGLDFQAYSSRRSEERGEEVTASFIEVKSSFLEAIKLRRVHESMPNDGTLVKLLHVLRGISPKTVLSSEELHQEEFRLTKFMLPVLAYVGEDANSPLCKAVVQQFSTVLSSNKGMAQAKAIADASALPKAVAVPPHFLSGSSRRGAVTDPEAATSKSSFRGSVPESRFNVDHLYKSIHQVYANSTPLEVYLMARSFRRMEYYNEVHWKELTEAAVKHLSQFPPNDLYQLVWYIVKAKGAIESGNGGGASGASGVAKANLRLRHLSGSALGLSPKSLKKAVLAQFDVFFASLERRLLEPASEAEVTRGAAQNEVQFRSSSSRMLRISEKDKSHLTGRPFLSFYTNHQHSGFLSAFRAVGVPSPLLSDGIEHHSHTLSKSGGLSSADHDAVKSKQREEDLRRRSDGSGLVDAEGGDALYKGSSERELNSYYLQGLQRFYDTQVTEDQETSAMDELTRISEADASATREGGTASGFSSAGFKRRTHKGDSSGSGSPSSLLIFTDKQTEQAVVACHVVLSQIRDAAESTTKSSSPPPLSIVSTLDPPKMLADLLAEEEVGGIDESLAEVRGGDDWGEDFLSDGKKAPNSQSAGKKSEPKVPAFGIRTVVPSQQHGPTRVGLQRLLKDLNGVLSATLRMASFRDRSLAVASPNKSSLRPALTTASQGASAHLSSNDLIPSLLGSALGIAYHTNLPPAAATLLLHSTLQALDALLSNAPELLCNSLSSHLPSLLHRGPEAGPISSQQPLLSWGELVSLLRVLVQLHANVSPAALALPYERDVTVGEKLKAVILRLLESVGPCGILDAVPQAERQAFIDRSVRDVPLTHLHSHPTTSALGVSTTINSIPYFLWLPQQMPLLCELMDTLRHVAAVFAALPSAASGGGGLNIASAPIVKALFLELSHKGLHFGRVGRGAWDGSLALRRGDWLRSLVPPLSSTSGASTECDALSPIVAGAQSEIQALEKIVKAAGSRVGTKLNTLSSPAITKSALLFVSSVCKGGRPHETSLVISTILDTKRYQIRDTVLEMSVGDLTQVIRALTTDARLISVAPNALAVRASQELLQSEMTDDASDAGYEESLRSYKKPSDTATAGTTRPSKGGATQEDPDAPPTPAADLSKSKWDRDSVKPTARFLLPTFYRQVFRKSKKVGQNALDWDARGQQDAPKQQTVASLFQPAHYEGDGGGYEEDADDSTSIRVRRPPQGAYITPSMCLVLLHSMLVAGVKDTPLILAVLKPILHQYTIKYKVTGDTAPSSTASSHLPASSSSPSSFTGRKNISALTENKSQQGTAVEVVATSQSALARKFSSDSQSLTAMEIASLAQWFVQLLGLTDTKDYALKHRLIQGLEDPSTSTTPSSVASKKQIPLMLSEELCGNPDNRKFVVDMCSRAIHAPGCSVSVLAKVMHSLSSLLVPKAAGKLAPSSPSWATGGGSASITSELTASGAEILLLAETLRRLRPAVGEASAGDLVLILGSMVKLRTMPQFSNAFVGDASSTGAKATLSDAAASSAALTKVTGGVELLEAKQHQQRRDVEGVLGSSETLALCVKRAQATASSATLKQVGELATVMDALHVHSALVEEVAGVLGARLTTLYPKPTTSAGSIPKLSEAEANALVAACVALGKIGPTHLSPYITGTLLWQGHYKPQLILYIANELKEAVSPLADKDPVFKASVAGMIEPSSAVPETAPSLLTNPNSLNKLVSAMANSGAGDGLTMTSEADRWLIGIAAVCSTCVGRVMNGDAVEELREWQNPLQLFVSLLDMRCRGELASTLVTTTTPTAPLATLVSVACHMSDLGFVAVGGEKQQLLSSTTVFEDLEREAAAAAAASAGTQQTKRNGTDMIPFLQTGLRHLFPAVFSAPLLKQRLVSRTEIGSRVGGGSSGDKKGGSEVGGNSSLAWRKLLSTPELKKEQDEAARKQKEMEDEDEKRRFTKALKDDTKYAANEHPLHMLIVDKRDKIKERPELIATLKRSNMVTWIVESRQDMDAVLRGDPLPTAAKMSTPFGALSLDAAGSEALRILQLSEAHKAAEKNKKRGVPLPKADEEIVPLGKGRHLDKFFAAQQSSQQQGADNTSFLSSLLGGMLNRGDRDAANLVIGGSGDETSDRVAQMLSTIGAGRSNNAGSPGPSAGSQSPGAALRAMKRAKNEAKKNLHAMGIMDEEDALALKKEVEKRMKRRVRADAGEASAGDHDDADDDKKKTKRGGANKGGPISSSLVKILHDQEIEMAASSARNEDDDTDDDGDDCHSDQLVDTHSSVDARSRVAHPVKVNQTSTKGKVASIVSPTRKMPTTTASSKKKQRK